MNPNSGQTKYSFKVMLNSCGTHFVDEFSAGKQAYLENVLVIQNEPGIQEVSTYLLYTYLRGCVIVTGMENVSISFVCSEFCYFFKSIFYNPQFSFEI